MKYFFRTAMFVEAYRKEHGQPSPNEQFTVYLVEYNDGRKEALLTRPKNYRHVKQVAFCVDGTGVAERLHGVWVQNPNPGGKCWLFQRALLKQLERCEYKKKLRVRVDVPSDIEPEVRNELQRYASKAVAELSDDFSRQVVAKMSDLLCAHGRFDLLKKYGTKLEHAPE